MIYKKHILAKKDISSQIQIPCIQFAKENNEYKVVGGNPKTTAQQKRWERKITEMDIKFINFNN